MGYVLDTALPSWVSLCPRPGQVPCQQSREGASVPPSGGLQAQTSLPIKLSELESTVLAVNARE